MELTYDLEAGVPQRPLGSCDGSQSRTQSSGGVPTNQQPSKHDGLYSQILENKRADRQEPTPEDEFYGRYDIGRITVNGFPSIAAFHAKYPNTRTCRAFEYLNHRITIRHQCQLTCLLGALVDLDIESARKSEIPDEKGSQPAPFDKDRFISRCLRSPDQISLVQIPLGDEGCEEDEEQRKERIEVMRENIFANTERIMDKYFKGNRINWQYELRKFPRASAKTHGKLFKYIKNMSGLDPEALDYLRADDDFIYADGNPLYEHLYNFLIYIRAAFVVSYLPLVSLW
ncbi:hypothetical protein E0Z10_g8994 [Xylaria hypoxylon]|uniref:DUF6594 domain-containing protein n=1 Tax=Xylaria hypoxylon TaxID=37992 RepID=A0A4Z0YID3_9PEZI|nr:hypothetical protein E0Z10_g8994 [Xylaria hypoxylon]